MIDLRCDHILEQCDCGDAACKVKLCVWCEAIIGVHL